MSKPAITYMKREWKKVLPVFILSICYAAFVFILVYGLLRNDNTNFRTMLAYTDQNQYFETGDMFLWALYNVLDKFHAFAVIVFEVLLVRKVFYQENKAGVSDFLRILPIRERNKILMKICAGESVILGFCAVFGMLGTFVHAILRTGLEERTAVFPPEKLLVETDTAVVATDTVQMIWKTSLLMFLALSAIFLVLFLMWCCVHYMPVALFTGFGILFAPYYYTWLYETVSFRSNMHMAQVAGSFLFHYPVAQGTGYAVGRNTITGYSAELEYYSEMVWFQVAVILIAAGILALALYRRWNVKESNNIMINSPAVSEFIVTGISLSAGTGVAVITGNASIATGSMGTNVFFFVTFIAGAVVWGIFHVISMAIMKRQRGV